MRAGPEQERACAFCGAIVRHDSLGAPTLDDRAWHAIQAQHSRTCGWAWSRGFKAPTMPDRKATR